MNIIYVVTSGEYSDYGIDAVFDTRELAEAFLASRAELYTIFQIEEYPINKYVDMTYMYKIDYDPWYQEGHQWRIERQDEEFVKKSQRFNHVVASEPHSHSFEDRARYYGAKRYTVWVKAKTRDAALKIANEKIMMAIAKGK